MSPNSPIARALLPAEPGVADWPAQDALTQRFLVPALAALEALFLHLRTAVDVDLAAMPSAPDKPYPLGRCLEITKAVEQQRQRIDPARLPAPAAAGYDALAAFLGQGGDLHRAWGDLRGQYFQNALIIGTLYVDAANDTVVPTKPKVEIKPLAEADFRPLRDYRHLVAVAEVYWGIQSFPNHILPEIAPYFPLLFLGADGRLTVKCNTDYMTVLTMVSGFAKSRDVLQAPPMDENLFNILHDRLSAAGATVAANPAEGRSRALRACDDYRAFGWHQSMPHARKALGLLTMANQHLAAFTFTAG